MFAVKESQRADCQFSLPCPAEQLEASHGRGLQLIGHDVAGDLDESKHGGNPRGSPPNRQEVKECADRDGRTDCRQDRVAQRIEVLLPSSWGLKRIVWDAE